MPWVRIEGIIGQRRITVLVPVCEHVPMYTRAIQKHQNDSYNYHNHPTREIIHQDEKKISTYPRSEVAS